MLRNINKNFEDMMFKLSIDKQYQKSIEKGRERYQLKIFKIENLIPSKVTEMFQHITTKFYFNRPTEPSEAWYENQLRVFVYVLLGYEYLHHKQIQKFQQHDWHFFSVIFNRRNPLFFEFQALSLLKKSSKSSKWDIHEVALLDLIIKTKSIKNKWNQIARELFIRSQTKFFKTSKQCRQYWINHLDPAPIRTPWTSLEDLELVRAVSRFGKKWAKVSKYMSGKRTEHMVKNRFKSLFNFQEKQRQRDEQFPIPETQIIKSLFKKCQICAEQQDRLDQIDINEKAYLEQDYNCMQKKEEQEDLNPLCFEKVTSKQSTQLQIEINNAIQYSEVKSNGYEKRQENLGNFFIEDCISAYINDDSVMDLPDIL